MSTQAYIFNESATGVLLVDGKFKIINCNQQFSLISNLPDHEIIGQNFMYFLPDKHSIRLSEIAVNAKNPFTNPHRLKIVNNEIVAVVGGFYPLPFDFPGKMPIFPGKKSGKFSPEFVYTCVKISAVSYTQMTWLEKVKFLFTEREAIVLLGFLNGKNPVQIAQTLNLTQKTIQNHVSKIKNKLALFAPKCSRFFSRKKW
ncbi:MAG: hypothetical protein GY874_09860 [Desulfobacteraceae bacterium]|nr:hypothetical protein [Desulfobacteraceae bacterium]